MLQAKDIKKKEGNEVQEIYQRISQANERGECKIFIPHFVYVSDLKILELLNNGFKVSKGRWYGGVDYGKDTIIEW